MVMLEILTGYGGCRGGGWWDVLDTGSGGLDAVLPLLVPAAAGGLPPSSTDSSAPGGEGKGGWLVSVELKTSSFEWHSFLVLRVWSSYRSSNL